ncbi:TonB-dependent receptor [Acetobacteraceae bacterium ESL0709]|nr:TonB-dependent receptor [Acetobacteraceae bacterium ESL0697]MDF7677798.1 TonB-dependent receptor [Acetobacteraceae bacterium ESL0709]
MSNHLPVQKARFSFRSLCLIGGSVLSFSTMAIAEESKPEDEKKKPAAAAPSSEETIIVKAQKREQMLVSSGGQLGVLGEKKGLDVPFNIRSYNSSLVDNQQSQSLGQVLQNDPAVRTTYGYGNFSELFIIRGFPVYGDDVAINGLYGIVPRQIVSPQPYGKIQLLNGASAFLNGAAPGGTSIGGTINLLFKHAESTPITRITGDYTGTGMGGGALDIGRRFGEGKQFGMRLNVAGMSGQTSIDHEKRHSTIVSYDTDWHDDKTRITLDMNYQNQGVQWGRPSVMLGAGTTKVPHPVKPSHNFGQPWSYNELNYISGMLNIEHDLTDNIMLYGAFGGLGGDEAGDYSTFTMKNAATGAGTTGAMYVPYIQTNESTRAGMRGHFDTGPVKHEINLGGSALWEDVDTAWSMGKATPSNIYNPHYVEKPDHYLSGGNINNPKRRSAERLYSLYFSDTMSFLKGRVALTGGFRYQNIMTREFDYKTLARDQHYDRDAITPVVGLVVHTTRHTSLYFNRIEGIAPGPQAPSSAINAGQLFSPYRTVQYEIGAKYDIGKLSASLAFYRMSQPNAYSTPYGTTGTTIFSTDGRQRNQGIEFNLDGEIVKGLRFNGGTSITDAVQRRTAKGLYDGNKAIGVAAYTINGNLEYDIPRVKGLTLTGRVTHTGHQYADNANMAKVASWTSFDLGGRYVFMLEKHPMTLRLSVENLANTRYWASAYGGYLTEGMPRTFKFSVTTDL